MNGRIREDDGMGMMIGGSNTNRKVITIKNIDGTTAGTISITKTAKKKKKRLQYNFKAISTQIMMSKTSNGANQAVSKARGKVAMLQRQQRCGDYDDTELQHAIIHAKKMERIARRRMKHLEEEEKVKHHEHGLAETEENTVPCKDNRSERHEHELSEKELRELIQELQELMKESMEELEDMTGLEELEDEITGSVKEDMAPEDLERLKKKHRADELREIAEADMEYLKALFNKLQKEKQECSSGVSLQLEGMEIPIEVVEMPVPVETEGGTIDCTV